MNKILKILILNIFLLIVSARQIPWLELCSFKLINIPVKTEPSDLAFGHENIYMVSDNGRLLIFDATDNLKSMIKIAGKPDLEGVAADSADLNVLYLGVGKKTDF
jgi:hypothetical protein